MHEAVFAEPETGLEQHARYADEGTHYKHYNDADNMTRYRSEYAVDEHPHMHEVVFAEPRTGLEQHARYADEGKNPYRYHHEV